MRDHVGMRDDVICNIYVWLVLCGMQRMRSVSRLNWITCLLLKICQNACRFWEVGGIQGDHERWKIWGKPRICMNHLAV